MKKTAAKTKKVANQLPPGWTEESVKKIIAYYENQSEEEAVEEAEAALARQRKTVMDVPLVLVPVIRGIIAEHQRTREARKQNHAPSPVPTPNP